MVLHSTLTGADLHNPLGHSDEGALAIPANTADAYRIEDDGASASLFAIDTTTGSERIWIGSSGASGTRVYLGMLAHTTDTSAPTAPSAGGCIYVKYNGISAYNVFVKGSDDTEYQLNASSGSGDVTGPGPTVADNAVALYDGTGGLTIKESAVTITSGAIAGVTGYTQASGVFSSTVTDNTANAFLVQQSTNAALNIRTSNTLERVEVGSTALRYALAFYAPNVTTGAPTLNANAAMIYSDKPGGAGTTTHLYAYDSDGNSYQLTASGGSGDVTGPGPTVTDNAISLFDGTGGLTIKQSAVTITSGAIAGVTGYTQASGTASFTVTDNTAAAFTVINAGSASALTVRTTNTLGRVEIGSTSERFAAAWFAPTGTTGAPTLNANAAMIYSDRPSGGSGTVHLYAYSSAGVACQLTGTPSFAMDDNTSNAFTVKQSSDNYIRIDTSNSNEAIYLGNTATNPIVQLLTNNAVTLKTDGSGTTAPLRWQMHNSNAVEYMVWNSLSLQTTSGTPTVTGSLLTLSDNTVYFFEVIACARAPAGSNDIAVYKRTAAYYRQSAGNATLLGSISADHTAESDAANFDCTLTTSTTVVNVSVTGDPTDTTEWVVHWRYFGISTS